MSAIECAAGARRPEDVATLGEEISGYVRQAELEGGGDAADELTPEAIEGLRSLGYIE